MRRRYGLNALAIGLAVAAWEATAVIINNPLTLPRFSATVKAWLALTLSGDLVNAFGLSLAAMGIGLAGALAVGIPLGLAAGLNGTLKAAVNPYLSIVLAIPTLAVVPVITTLFGFTLTSRIIVVFLFCIVMIVVSTSSGVGATQPALVEMARCFGVRGRQMLYKIILPSALPGIFAGVRLGIGRAFVGMVASELLISATGLGSLLMRYNSMFRRDAVFAIVLSIILFAVFVMAAAERIERKLMGWALTNEGDLQRWLSPPARDVRRAPGRAA